MRAKGYQGKKIFQGKHQFRGISKYSPSLIKNSYVEKKPNNCMKQNFPLLRDYSQPCSNKNDLHFNFHFHIKYY